MYTYAQGADTVALSATGTVRTRHGLTIRTARSGEAARGTILVAGTPVSQAGRGGFDAAFEQLADTSGRDVAVSVGKMLECPLGRVALDDGSGSDRWRAPALPAAAAILSAALGVIPLAVSRLRRIR